MLDFISDDKLRSATQTLIDAAKRGAQNAERDLYRNVIDPFSALVDSAYQGISLEEWFELEKIRQTQKSLQNAIGDFHQEILGSMPGWNNIRSGGGYDLINDEGSLIVEVKNKFNTMNSSSGETVHNRLSRYLDENRRFQKAYVVEIIPKNKQRYEKPFSPGKGTRERADLILIDGHSFYDLASGQNDALVRLYRVLPEVLSELLSDESENLSDERKFVELFERVYGVFE